MEADISIWRKPGHFYFALTRIPGYLQGETTHWSQRRADKRLT